MKFREIQEYDKIKILQKLILRYKRKQCVLAMLHNFIKYKLILPAKVA